MDEIVKTFGNKKNVKEFEDFIQEAEEVKKFFINSLSRYNADKVGYLRWAITDPTGRQALYFKKHNQKSKLEYDYKGELISSIWYYLFLQNREYYLTERVWKYTEKENQIRKHIIIDFDSSAGRDPETVFSQCKYFNFPSTFLNDLLEKKHNILEELESIVKEIIVEMEARPEQQKLTAQEKMNYIMPKIREIQVNGKMLVWQQEGIRNALKEWLKQKDTLGKILDECFKCFYPEKIEKRENLANKPIPIFKYESASQFLSMFQNIAIFCPGVKVLHLFSYTSVNKRLKSSLTFFYNDKNLLLSSDDKIFNILNDIESAVPYILNQKKSNTWSYPLWSFAFNRLPEKKRKMLKAGIRKSRKH